LFLANRVALASDAPAGSGSLQFVMNLRRRFHD